jgi:hypothetical protein
MILGKQLQPISCTTDTINWRLLRKSSVQRVRIEIGIVLYKLYTTDIGSSCMYARSCADDVQCRPLGRHAPRLGLVEWVV